MKQRTFSYLLLLLLAAPASAQEFRAMWVDTFHAGLRNSNETTAVIDGARAAGCNAVIVEVRKRGDAYYRGGLEPVATDVAAGFDPLADLIQRGHTGSPRVEVHAWVVTYNIWNNETTPPSQPTHPFNLHPDWICENNVGEQWDGGNYQLDPGHPGVQQHTYNVVMDILTRYDVDGIHFDYVRYSEHDSTINNQPWGYNPVTLARYQTLKNVSTIPLPTSSTWLQWRRDQVTALVRKVYLNAWAVKPHVRISAALIPWGSPPASLSLSAWQSTNAYARVLQDWRGWMEEGILDLACPMVYRTDSSGFDGWADFAKDRQYNRAAAIGMGWYLNTIANTTTQIGFARDTSAGGRTAVGVVGYSYAVPNSEGISKSSTWSAFASGPFASPAGLPSMHWKTNATKGHAMGYVRAGDTGEVFDGATVTLTGPSNRTLTTDATGFFGAVDLPVGSYTATISLPGFRTLRRTFTVTGSAVAQPATQLELVPFLVTSTVRSATGNTFTITWNSVPGRTYRVERSNNLTSWSPVVAGITATSTSTTYPWGVPAGWTTRAYLRVALQ